jgi:hypothetical protein
MQFACEHEEWLVIYVKLFYVSVLAYLWQRNLLPFARQSGEKKKTDCGFKGIHQFQDPFFPRQEQAPVGILTSS